jgi:hypothetical protein
MIRQLSSAILTFGFTLLILGGAAAPAFAADGHYRAEPAATTVAGRIVARDMVWRCGPADCVAPKGSSRPAVVCAVLVREVGPLRSFSADGQPLAAEELEKCNARAR